MSFWLYNGFRCGQRNDAFREFTPLLGEAVLRMFSRTVNVSCAGRGKESRARIKNIQARLFATEQGLTKIVVLIVNWTVLYIKRGYNKIVYTEM